MTINIYQDEKINGTLEVTGEAKAASVTATGAADFNSLGVNAVTALLNKIYPIGSVYTSTNSTSPASFIGGTWARIQDQFLLAAGTKYTAGSTGGSADAVLVEHKHGERGNNENYDFPQFYKLQGGSSSTQTMIVYNDTSTYYPQSTDNWVRLNTDYTGESGTGKNMPPYLAVYAWRRTA